MRMTLVESLTEIAEEMTFLLEQGPHKKKGKSKRNKHYPFKTKGHLGPGPRSREMDKTDKWSCKRVGAYVQRCTIKRARKGQGKEKIIRIDPDYKKAYNREYKAWRSGKGEDRLERLLSVLVEAL